MAAEIEFDDREINEFLKDLSNRLGSAKDAKREFVGLISAIIYRDVIEHFEKEEGPEGKWSPWSQIYAEKLREEGRAGNKILQYSGRLRQNFKPTNFRSADAGILWFNDAKTAEGFPYAEAHDEGAGRLPQREFMWLTDKAMENISQQTLEFIVGEGD